ncbi:hypothetical protein OU798_22385 [Prolixibacteraceae bacterium Z1-6]|uniref:Uncharacterized protein n=1 Tax=Draconibacterium aestuarii TaxID=2998507 RepID=A0A9X3FI49_9BACT|nr:hypothetical protein [Prolixibacteraceae bacterium Z1-6]
MNTNTSYEEAFDDHQILQTLKTAVATSKRTLMDDGLLLICWGLVFSIGFFWKYLVSVVLISSRIRDFMSILNVAAGIAIVAFTVYFIFFRNKKVRT